MIRQIEPSRIRSAHDKGQSGKRVRVEAKFLNHHVKSALVAPVAPESFGNVKWGCLEANRYRGHLRGSHKQKQSFRIDEPANEPRTGDANDLGPRPRHPDGSAGRVRLGQLVRANKQLPAVTPSIVAAFKSLSIDALLPHQGAGTLAEMQSLSAHQDC